MLYVATEDSWAQTIVPRFIAAGADLRRVHAVTVKVGGSYGSPILPVDQALLRDEIDRVGARLVILDPLVSVLHSGLDSHKDHSIRQALDPINQLAGATQAAVVGITHLNKGAGSDVLDRVIGSRAFTAAARAVLAVTTDEAEEGARLVAMVKSNLGRLDVPAFRYRVVAAQVPTDEGPALVGRVEWLGEVAVDVRDLLRDVGDADERSAVDEATDWLRSYLEHKGASEARAVKKAARVEGVAERTLQRARIRLGVEITRPFGAPTRWALKSPQQATAVPPMPVVPAVPHRHPFGTGGTTGKSWHGFAMDEESAEPLSIVPTPADLFAARKAAPS